MEQLADIATDSLNGAINNSQTSIVLHSVASFPDIGNFHILIDSEYILVTAVNVGTNTFTVVRGIEGSTAVSHLNSAGVACVWSEDGFDSYRADNCQSVNFGSLPGASISGGRLYFPEDNLYAILDNNNSLPFFGPIKKLSVPDLTSFTHFNFDTNTTVDNTNGGIWLYNPQAISTDKLSILKKALPTPPYSVKACILGNWDDRNYLSFGIGFRESATSKLETNQVVHSTNCELDANQYSNENTFFGNRQQTLISQLPDNIIWLKSLHDGTNIHHYFSVNGINYYEYSSFAKNNYFTTDADEVIFFINNDGGTSGAYAIGAFLISWEEGTT